MACHTVRTCELSIVKYLGDYCRGLSSVRSWCSDSFHRWQGSMYYIIATGATISENDTVLNATCSLSFLLLSSHHKAELLQIGCIYSHGCLLGSAARRKVNTFTSNWPQFILILMQCRTLAAATLATSLLVYTKMLSGYYVVFWPGKLFQFPPQLWRLATCFFVTGKDLGIIFDTYFRMGNTTADLGARN